MGKKFKDTIACSISGNSATATKATQDSAGQQINTTYIKGLSVSGKTVTYTKGDGTTGTITTQDTNTTYSVGTASALGLTKLYTGTGTATDGTMTQSAIKTALDGKAASSHGTHLTIGTGASNAAAGNHTHSYLPLSGGTMTGKISGGAMTGTWVAAAGGSSFINSTGSAGTFHPMLSAKTTNGGMTLAFYQNALQVGYLTKANIDASTNTLAKNAILMDESGNGTWPGTVSATSFTENGTALSSKYAAASHGTHLTIGTGSGNAAAGNHTHSYLPLSGGTMTGKITTPNNAQGITIGDDVTLCDRNVANMLVLEGSSATSGGVIFGSGLDTNIYRGAANQLKTDDTFYAVGEIVSGSNVRSDTALTDNLGTAAIPWKTTYSKQVYLYGEASKRYGYLSTPTIGTTSTVGECLLVLGNDTASGTASNATGMIYLYGTNTGGTYLKTAHTGTGTYNITLPAKSGTVACTSDLDSYSKTSHTHNYAGSSSAGGAANNSTQWGGYSIWVGSLSSYNSISSKSSTTLYFITG